MACVVDCVHFSVCDVSLVKSFAMCLKLISHICLSPYFHARGADERVFIDLTIHQCHATSFTVWYTAYELYFL